MKALNDNYLFLCDIYLLGHTLAQKTVERHSKAVVSENMTFKRFPKNYCQDNKGITKCYIDKKKKNVGGWKKTDAAKLTRKYRKWTKSKSQSFEQIIMLFTDDA